MADDFLSTYAPLANDIATRTNIDPSVVLGIIDTETWHGQHVSGNNIFGISPVGPQGQYVASYPDVQTASNAFINLMQTPRYAGVPAASDLVSQSVALVKSGYNTANPNYASIVANKALQFGKQLGYQDGSGGGASINVSSSQPAPDYSGAPAPAATASTPDYNTPAPAAAPAPQAQPPAGSAKDRVLADPALGGDGGSSAAPAQGQTAKDRLLADPALQTTETTEKPPQGPLPSVSEYGDLGNQWWNTQAQPPPGQAPDNPAVNAIQRVIQAGAEGGTGAPDASGWAPGGLQLGRYIVNPLLEVGGALLRGGQQAAAEVAEPIGWAVPQVQANIPLPGGRSISGTIIGGPGLGRDVAALPEAFPTGFDTGRNLLQPEAPPAPTPKFISELTMPPREAGQSTLDRINQLLQHDEAERVGPPQAAEQPPVTPASPGVSATTPAQAADNTAWVGKTIDQVGNVVQENAAQGGPASLGAAATPEQLAAMSPEMAKAYRRMAEINRVVSPIEGEDTSIKVPGSVPTEAEAKGDPITSTKEVMTRQYRPEAFEGPQGVLTKNNAARLQLFDDQTLSDPQIASLSEDQAKQAQADAAVVARNAVPVDGTPVAAQLKQTLANPRIMEQPDLVKVLQPIHDALYNPDGTLKTDIQQYWGMHDNLMTQLAKAKDPLNASSSEKFAFNQILDAKNAVDAAMNKASGGAFQTFLDNQSRFFQQKNAATILRDFRAKPGMTNPNTGMIQPNAFHRFVTDLAVRRGRPGIDPAQDIPDEVMGKLMDIDDDLKRAGRIDLGKPRGSPTNLYFELANGLGIVGAHSVVHAMGGGPVANLALQSGINALKQRVARIRTNALVNQALNYPPQGPTFTPNPNPPGAFVPPNRLQFPPPL